MNEFLIFIIIAFWGWISSYFAQQRGRNPYGWFFLGVLFGPFTLVGLFLMPIIKPELPPVNVKEVHVSHHSPFEQYDWYYLDEKRQSTGPLTFNELQQCWDEKKIDEQSLIWNETMENWKKVTDVSELKESLTVTKKP